MNKFRQLAAERNPTIQMMLPMAEIVGLLQQGVGQLLREAAYGVPPPFLAWSRDGRWLVSLEQNSPHETFSIVGVSVETGEKRRLTFPSIRSSGA